MTGKTTRGHLKDIYRQKNEHNDRRAIRQTKYGNPFKIGDLHPDTGSKMTRDDVCDLFEQRVLPTLDVEPLRGKRILCTCELHERCHVDSIIQKLERNSKMIEQHEIKSAVLKIKEHHSAFIDLMAKADERAEAIGQILLNLQPTLQKLGISISKLCEDLPFGKSAAYEYMAIAKGKVSWDNLNARKNPTKNSATAENDRVARMPIVPDYKVDEAMGAITGMAWLYAKEYKGTSEDAAKVLMQELLKTNDDSAVGLSITRDRMHWLLEFKAVLDFAEPEIRSFLSEKPNLKVVVS